LTVGDSTASTGNVGISTKNPTQRLDVNGGVRVRNLTEGIVVSDADGVLSVDSVLTVDSIYGRTGFIQSVRVNRDSFTDPSATIASIGDSGYIVECFTCDTIQQLLDATAIYRYTYAQASDTANAGALVPLAWYNITDNSVYIQAVTDSTFGLNGYYADSTIWEIDAIEFDFENEHIQQRCDKRGNCVGSSFAVTSLMGVNPIDVFAWGNDNVLGNTVKDAFFDLSSNPDPSVAGNIINFLSEVTVTSDENFWNNTFSNTSASIEDNATVSYGIFKSSTLLVSGASDMNNAYANNSSITLTGSVTAGYIQVYNSTVEAGNSAGITSALLREQSVLIVSDTVIANGIELWEGDTVILSGTVNAINVRCYTGADIEASGSAFIEGMVVMNVSKVFASDAANMGSTLICNQSTVTISGNVDMGNNHIASSDVGFTDSVRCRNCWFYSVNDTFDGITLDTFNYTINNRSTFNKTLDVNTFYLTDGTQANGYVLTSDASGNATWQDPNATPAARQSNSTAPTNGGSDTIPDNTEVFILSPASLLATYTLTLPENPVTNQLLYIVSSGFGITALTLNVNSGQSIVGALTTLTANVNALYFFDGTVWIKL
jgi:hypothetical protein